MPIPRRKSVKVQGRVLYLTEDPEVLKRQLVAGETVPVDPERDPLIDNISTDEITPGWVCYYYDETLARYSLVGLRGGKVKPDARAIGINFSRLIHASKFCKQPLNVLGFNANARIADAHPGRTITNLIKRHYYASFAG